MKYIHNSHDAHKIAHYQRLNQYKGFVPGFTEELNADPIGTIKRLGLDLTLEDIRYERDKNGKTIPLKSDGALAKYLDYCNEKLDWVEKIRNRPDSDFASSIYAKWHKRQTQRSFYQLTPSSFKSLIHAALSFELSLGCSVGCKFCGLNAGKLCGIYRYTDENAALWRDVLSISHRLLGNCAEDSFCYYATEPLDNPDYERFIDDFRAELSRTPQITTAAGLRDIERTRRIFAELDINRDTIHRMSVHSLEDFYTIMDAFTPEELLLVELLPQYEQAPLCALSSVGRNHSEGESYGTTIACLSGFLINMYTKTIRLMTPTNPCDKYPSGQICIREEKFTDSTSFEIAMSAIISDMKNILSPKEALHSYPWVHLDESGGELCIISDEGMKLKITKPEIYDIIKTIFGFLEDGSYTRKQIVEKLKLEAPEYDSAILFYLINSWWNSGIIWDSQLFGEPEIKH